MKNHILISFEVKPNKNNKKWKIWWLYSCILKNFYKKYIPSKLEMECKKDIHFSLDFGWFSVHGRFAEQTKSFNMMKVICRQSLRGWYFFFGGGGGERWEGRVFQAGWILVKKNCDKNLFSDVPRSSEKLQKMISSDTVLKTDVKHHQLKKKEVSVGVHSIVHKRV